MQHQVLRVRHELKRRRLIVRENGRVTPAMIRVVLAGPDLADDFVSAGFDDHVKLFLLGGAEPTRRDYTPRAFDAATGTLTLDFVVHDAGSATQWALAARPGDMLELGGPRGSVVVPDDFNWWLLVGDETALPAIGRCVEEAAPGARITTLAAVTDAAEEPRPHRHRRRGRHHHEGVLESVGFEVIPQTEHGGGAVELRFPGDGAQPIVELTPLEGANGVKRPLGRLRAPRGSIRVPLRRRRAVLQVATSRRRVTPELARDRGCGSVQGSGDVTHAVPSNSEQRDLLAFRE